jgi:chaperonin GroEL
MINPFLNKNNKQNIFINDTKRLDKGFLEACDVVVTTLGAEGKLALTENTNTNLPPEPTKDGVTVMQHIRKANKVENFGVLQAIAGAAVTLQKSGDSTTTTACFMQGYIRNLNRKHFNKKVEKGIKIGLEEVKNKLEELSSPITNEGLELIIRTSVNNDISLSKVIYEAFNSAGEEGTVEVVKNPNNPKTIFTEQNGMYLDSHGYTTAFFINKESKASYDSENVSILCSATWEVDMKLVQAIKNFYQKVDRKTPLVLFLERPNSDMNEEMLKLKNIGCNICVVAVNGYDEYESETLLNDIALLTGAKVYNPRDEKPEFILGLADKLVATSSSTTISVFEAPQAVADLVSTLELVDKKDERRVKRLKGKVVIIEVGGLNSSQIKEEFDRVEDAIASVKSSKAEGYIVGGGATLVHISNTMNTVQETREIQRGYNLVKKIINQPFIKILENANRKTKTEWWHFLRKDYLKSARDSYGWGYNASTDEISNLIEDGVIDSKKSIRIALESSTERAIQMFNIGTIVTFPQSIEL